MGMINNAAEEYREKRWLLEQYEKTGSIYKMAQAAGCHPRTIHKWMVKNGIEMHGMKGQKRDEDTIRRAVMARAGKPGPMTGKHHSQQTRLEMSVSRAGSNNANWKGGITEKVRRFRRTKEYVAWVKAVLHRAGGKCEECGCEENLEAHHIISIHKDFSKALDVENVMALCKSCHAKKHRRKKDDE